MANTEAALLRIFLRRQDSSHPWGFRLQGGADFQTPITIQLVQPNSIADHSGLQAGDYVLMINDQPTMHLSHEQAKMEIIRSANDFTFQVQRGGAAVWQPKQTVLSQPVRMQAPAYSQEPLAQVTRTSLRANQRQEFDPIGSSHNRAAVPFSVPDKVMTTGDGRVKRVAHSQFNSPLGLYSEQNVSTTYQDTLQQARGFGGGGGQSDSMAPGFRSVQAPTGPPPGSKPRGPAMTGSMYCGICGDMIKGVFIKVQGRIPMHPDCLKCTKCGVGLRTQGYFYINEKLYCETHAKQVARPPDHGMKPVAVYK